MRRFLDSLYAASLVLAACFLVGILLLMVGEAVVRSLGGYITGANELIGWSCAAAGFLALPSTFKKGDLIRVGFLVDWLAPPLRKVLLLLSLSLAWIFVGYMLKAVGLYLYDGWVHEEISQGMIMVPVWIPQSSFLLGSLLLWIAIMDEWVRHVRAPAQTLRAEKPIQIQDDGMVPGGH